MADARLSEDRRTLLRSMLALGAIGATAIAAGTATAAELAPDNRDAELFALLSVMREAKARRLAATGAMHEAERRVPYVTPPSALIATDSDARLWESVKVGEPVPDEIMRQYRASRARDSEQSNARQRLARQCSMLRFEKFSPENDLDMAFYRDEIMRQLRMMKLLPADSEWRGARHQASVSSGAWAAVERQEALLYEELDLVERRSNF